MVVNFLPLNSQSLSWTCSHDKPKAPTNTSSSEPVRRTSLKAFSGSWSSVPQKLLEFELDQTFIFQLGVQALLNLRMQRRTRAFLGPKIPRRSNLPRCNCDPRMFGMGPMGMGMMPLSFG